LRVSSSYIDAADTFALARLEELYLDDVSSDPAIEEIVSPSTFPALRVLSFTDCQEDLSTLLRKLEPQLDLIWMNEDDIERLGPGVFDQINRKTLFDRLCSHCLTPPNVKSYRLWDSQHPEHSTIEKLEEIVRATTTPLPSVLYLAGCHSDDPHDPALEAPRQRFRDVCKERNMEVIYEATPDWRGDFGRPTEFYRRMRAGKIKGTRE